MRNDFSIPREVLEKALGNPRAVTAFERIGVVLSETADATTANVADTQALKDASFVTLSANSDLPNERVLQFGSGLRGDVTTGTVTLRLDRNVPQATGGFSVLFVAAGDSQLGLPPTGTLATQEWAAVTVRGLVPSAAGAPSHTPTPPAGFLETYYDTTNNQFYVYNGGWKKVALT
jgi:hypothetical protein